MDSGVDIGSAMPVDTSLNSEGSVTEFYIKKPSSRRSLLKHGTATVYSWAHIDG